MKLILLVPGLLSFSSVFGHTNNGHTHHHHSPVNYKSFKLFDLSSFRSRAMLLENKLPNRQSNGFQNSPKNVKSSTFVFYIIPSFGDTSKISFSGAIHKLRCLKIGFLTPPPPSLTSLDTILAYVVLLTFAV